VTETTDWMREAQAIKAHLSSIERAAVEGKIPPEPMTTIKGAVDHCRTTLWAVVTAAASDADSARTATILAARLARVEEMCNRIVEEVAAGHIWVGTAGLGRFVATLDVTERCVRALLEESVSSQGE
jgi:hypothetical protein